MGWYCGYDQRILSNIWHRFWSELYPRHRQDNRNLDLRIIFYSGDLRRLYYIRTACCKSTLSEAMAYYACCGVYRRRHGIVFFWPGSRGKRHGGRRQIPMLDLVTRMREMNFVLLLSEWLSYSFFFFWLSLLLSLVHNWAKSVWIIRTEIVYTNMMICYFLLNYMYLYFDSFSIAIGWLLILLKLLVLCFKYWGKVGNFKALTL